MPEVGQDQLVDGEIRPDRGSREPTAVGKPLGQEPIILGSTLRGAIPAKIDVPTVQGNNGLIRRFVMPVRGSAK
jgi:hypothetical protein